MNLAHSTFTLSRAPLDAARAVSAYLESGEHAEAQGVVYALRALHPGPASAALGAAVGLSQGRYAAAWEQLHPHLVECDDADLLHLGALAAAGEDRHELAYYLTELALASDYGHAGSHALAALLLSDTAMRLQPQASTRLEQHVAWLQTFAADAHADMLRELHLKLASRCPARPAE